MLFPNLEASIQTDRISIRNLAYEQDASADAPFSCSHQLIDDVDIFEHACHQLLKQVLSTSWWSFPRVRVSTPGRPLHTIEMRVIRELLQNAGAHEVTFDPSISACDEQRSAQRAYVEKASRKR